MNQNLLTSIIHYDLLRSSAFPKNKSHSLHSNKQTSIYLQYQQVNNNQKEFKNHNFSQNDLISQSNNFNNKLNTHNRIRAGSLEKINKIKNHRIRQEASSSSISKKKNLIQNRDKNITQHFLSFVKKNKQMRRNHTQMPNIYVENPLVKQLANKNHNSDLKIIQQNKKQERIQSIQNNKTKNRRKNIIQTTKSLLQSPTQYQQDQPVENRKQTNQKQTPSNNNNQDIDRNNLSIQCPHFHVAKNVKQFSMKQLVLTSLKTNINKFKSKKEKEQQQQQQDQMYHLKGSFAYQNQNNQNMNQQTQKKDNNIKYFKSLNTKTKSNEDKSQNINASESFNINTNSNKSQFNIHSMSPKNSKYKQFKKEYENQIKGQQLQKYCSFHYQHRYNPNSSLNANLITQMIKYRQKIQRYKQKKSRQYQAKNKLGMKIIKVAQKSINAKSEHNIKQGSDSNQKQSNKIFSSLPFSGQMKQTDCIIPPQDDIFQFNDSITKVALKLLSPLNKKITSHQDSAIEKSNSPRSDSNSSKNQFKLQHNPKLSHQIKKQRQQKLQKMSKLNKNQSGLYCLYLGSQEELQNNPKIIIKSLTSQKKGKDSPKMQSLILQNVGNSNIQEIQKSKLRSNNSIVLNSFNCFMMNHWQVQQKNENSIIQNQSNFYEFYKDISKSSKNKNNNFYYYYVGYGNNHPIIIQIMKKRKAWKQTNNIHKANFVWTQLKMNELFKKQQFSANIKKVIQQSLTILQRQEKSQKLEQNQLLNQQQKMQQSSQLTQISHSTKLKLILKQLQKQNNENQSKILSELAVEKQLIYISNQKKKDQLKQKILLKSHQSIKKIYHQNQILSKLSKISKPSMTTTILSDKITIVNESVTNQEQNKNILKKDIISNPIFEPNFIHNHFQGSCCIGNKKQLLNILTLYETYSNKKITQKYLPLSFHLETEQDDQYQKLITYFDSQKTQNKQKSPLIWILKPGQNTNRGHGIMLTKSLYQIKNILRSKSQSQKQQTLVVQKYLTKVFLYQKRKFDIRVYMLVLTINNQTKYFFYQEGYIRTSSLLYNLQDLDDVFVHLTNDAVQQRHQKYSYYEKGNKLSYHEFQKYLDFNYAQQNYSMSKLHRKMKNIVADIAKVSYFKINSSKIQNNSYQNNSNMKPFGFQLFGLDFIIDHKFKPWLLEVNTNPCLQLKSPILQRLIPRMLQNMFRLCLDPLFVKHLNKDLNNHNNNQFQKSIQQGVTNLSCENILQINRWQLIHDSLYDRDKSWQQFYLKAKIDKKLEKQRNNNIITENSSNCSQICINQNNSTQIQLK